MDEHIAILHDGFGARAAQACDQLLGVDLPALGLDQRLPGRRAQLQ
jgi:hypothetical protein